MATAVTSDKIFTKMAITQNVIAVDATGGVDAGWVDMRDYEGLAVSVVATALTGNGLTDLVIEGSASSDGSSSSIIKTVTISGTPDAVGDTINFSITADQMREVGAFRYANALVTTNNAADTLCVTYVRYPAKRQADGLTAAEVIA